MIYIRRNCITGLALTLWVALLPALAQKPSYTVTDLGPVGPVGQPFNVSSNSLTTGDALSGSGYHATVWYRGQQIDIHQSGFGGANSVGFAVSARAQVVGAAETATADPYGEDFCGFQTNTVCLPYLWQNGFMTPLPTLGGRSGVANFITAGGQIVGMAENNTLDAACPAPQKFQFRPVLWSGGKVQELPLSNGDPVGVAYSMNDSGQVVGTSGLCATFSPYYLANIVPTHMLLWQNGIATDLGNLGGSGKFAGNIAFAINNKGQVVGNSDLAGDTTNHGFLWQNGHIRDLGTLPGDAISASLAINDSGDVVGVSVANDFSSRAVIWKDNAILDLNTVVPADSPLFLLFACSINARGEIVGQALDKATGVPHGYLLTPRPGGTPPTSVSEARRSEMLHPRTSRFSPGN